VLLEEVGDACSRLLSRQAGAGVRLNAHSGVSVLRLVVIDVIIDMLVLRLDLSG
jgi:hypothetical protein